MKSCKLVRLQGFEPWTYGLGNHFNIPQSLPKPHFSRLPFPSNPQELPKITKPRGTKEGQPKRKLPPAAIGVCLYCKQVIYEPHMTHADKCEKFAERIRVRRLIIERNL